jgi:hypothetical protein
MISSTGPLGRRARSRWLAAPVACIALLALAALPVIAQATGLAAGKPIALSNPGGGSPPLVAYDPVSKTTFVAWSYVRGSENGIELCVLPSGSSGCENSGPSLLAFTNGVITGSNTLSLGGLVVLADGDVVVAGDSVTGGTVDWESTADGSAFLSGNHGLQDGGSFISPVNLTYAFDNVASLGSSDVGLLDDYYGYFSDSPVAGPASPNLNSPNSNAGTLFQRKSLYSSGPEITAEPAPVPAPLGDYVVVAAGDNYSGSTLPSCTNSAASGYAVSIGQVDGTSKASGTLNNEGIPSYGVLACSALAPALASGKDGIGVLEDEGNGVDGTGDTYTVDYRPFKLNSGVTGGSFGAAVKLASYGDEPDDIDLATDSGTGVYAMWDEGGIHFDYSPDGGAHWDGAVKAPYLANSSGDQIDGDHPIIAGVGNGTLAYSYDDLVSAQGTQDFVQFIRALPTPWFSSKQKAGRRSGVNITIPGGTVGETDKATLHGASPLAGGTLTYALYSNKQCTAKRRVFSSTRSVTKGSVDASYPITNSLKVGNYYWKLSYSGDSNDKSSTSKCGSEKLTIKKPKRV